MRALLSPRSLDDGSSLSARCADAAAVKSSVGMLRRTPPLQGTLMGSMRMFPPEQQITTPEPSEIHTSFKLGQGQLIKKHSSKVDVL